MIFDACDCVLQWYNYHPDKDGTRTYHRSRQTIHSLQACITLRQELEDDDTAFLSKIIILVVASFHRFAACDCVLQWHNHHPAEDGTRTYHRSRQTIHSLQAMIIGRKVILLVVRDYTLTYR